MNPMDRPSERMKALFGQTRNAANQVSGLHCFFLPRRQLVNGIVNQPSYASIISQCEAAIEWIPQGMERPPQQPVNGPDGNPLPDDQQPEPPTGIYVPDWNSDDFKPFANVAEADLWIRGHQHGGEELYEKLVARNSARERDFNEGRGLSNPPIGGMDAN